MKRTKLFVAMSLLFVCRWGVASGQTLTPLWQFGSLSNFADGVSPWAGLIQGSDGNFYGTAGGTAVVNCTVFKITPAGTLTTLWQFGSLSNNADGNSPMASLVQGCDGDFYGTTSYGGTNRHAGTVYKITSAGTFTPLWQFGSLPNYADGASPSGELVLGADGNFYGATFEGGTNSFYLTGDYGTVFKITPAGTLTPLWQFGSLSNNADGRSPAAALVQGRDGNFYGTTVGGGVYNYGTVFKITPAGTLTPLWQFTGGADGRGPIAALAQGGDGNFYGTTQSGSIFQITSAGTLTTLSASGGRNALVQGCDGNFYGTTTYGGTQYGGTAFQITPAGTLTVLWQFGSLSNNADGEGPMAGLVQGCDGSFYGTTAFGGTNNQEGTVFKLTVPLNPPANQISNVGIAGTDIVFAIPSVAHETYQLQYRADLNSGDWSNVDGASVTNGIGALLTVTHTGGASSPQGFYRFDITP
jgi:uncharacterized repeat protein (TIGR03803 family)